MMQELRTDLPRVALTLGDVAGIGPEVAIRAALNPRVRSQCQPICVGDEGTIRRTLALLHADHPVQVVSDPAQLDSFPVPDALRCWDIGWPTLSDVPYGAIHASAGRAAYIWLLAATQAALAGKVDAIVTAPLNKAALQAGGIGHPGHTEILAEQCSVADFAMMLYLPAGTAARGPHGLGVAHVTLHTSIASVPKLLSKEGIRQKIELMHWFLLRVGCRKPRIGVCALNPHAGEGGLFGDEELRLISPAVDDARRSGIEAVGPLPADTLLKRSVAGEFDGVVAMYHDQGHIALKLVGFNQAVNITLGLPIIRTSPSHGTAFDIAGRGVADSSGMERAIEVAVKLVHEAIK